ncbi:MAG: hypothetical protein IJ071_00530 [Ruminococcus sp.]|nr:hypothetical protein [Ruminococcus sp.]
MEAYDNFVKAFNSEYDQSSFQDGEKNNIYAILGYLIPVLFFLPFVINKNSAFCRFHSNQGLAWLICSAVIGIVGKIIGIIPFLGGLIGFILGAVWLAITLSLAYGVVKGYAIRIPVVGDLIKVF